MAKGTAQRSAAAEAARAMTPLKPGRRRDTAEGQAYKAGTIPQELANRLHDFDAALAALRRSHAGMRRELNGIWEGLRGHVHADGEPAYRNGVHIDSAGYYWMRREGVWQPMVALDGSTAWDPVPDGPVFPVQRLAERD